MIAHSVVGKVRAWKRVGNRVSDRLSEKIVPLAKCDQRRPRIGT